MTKTAWMFPGQGSQSPGMGRQLLEEYPAARQILELAEQASGQPLEQLRRRGPTSSLSRPSVAEPLITAISIGYVEALRSHGFHPDCVAGYSAGEVAAFYAAGVLSLEQAIEVAVIRGRLFEEYCSTESRMVTIAGVAIETVSDILGQLSASDPQVYIAAQNGLRHTTIVGDEQCVLAAEERLSRLGAEISQVNVGGKWHSIHLAPATEILVNKLSKQTFLPPACPILTSASAEFRSSPRDLIVDLSAGVSRPVMWRQIVKKLDEFGVNQFYECGSGRVLFGLMRWNEDQLGAYEAVCVEDRNYGLRPLKRLAQQKTASEGMHE